MIEDMQLRGLAALRLLLETDTHYPLPDELSPPSPTLPKETLLCPICGKALLRLYTSLPPDAALR